MTKALQVVMPLAGEGKRFSGHTQLIKPLINICGRPMFTLALSSLENFVGMKKLFFVFRKEHDKAYGLGKIIHQWVSGAQNIIIHGTTQGPLHTVTKAFANLDPQLPVLVLDCDLYFKSDAFINKIRQILDGKDIQTKGLLLTFTSSHPRYSYAIVDKDNKVLQTAEKRAISTHALAGAYFFSCAQDLMELSQTKLALPTDPLLGEYYLSEIFDDLIKLKGDVIALPAEEYRSFGTPDELTQFQISTSTSVFPSIG